MPAVGRVRPSRILTVVVLPAPFGPSRPKTWPCSTRRSMPPSAVIRREPKRDEYTFERPTASMGIAIDWKLTKTGTGKFVPQKRKAAVPSVRTSSRARPSSRTFASSGFRVRAMSMRDDASRLAGRGNDVDAHVRTEPGSRGRALRLAPIAEGGERFAERLRPRGVERETEARDVPEERILRRNGERGLGLVALEDRLCARCRRARDAARDATPSGRTASTP